MDAGKFLSFFLTTIKSLSATATTFNIRFFFVLFVSGSFELTIQKDRERIPKQHLNETVEELKRFNARRKLKGAVQSISGGFTNDPLCGDTDSGKNAGNKDE